jgi:hypothetical protein
VDACCKFTDNVHFQIDRNADSLFAANDQLQLMTERSGMSYDSNFVYADVFRFIFLRSPTMFRLTPLLICSLFAALFAFHADAAESERSRLLPPTSHLLAADPGLVLVSERLSLSCDELQCKVDATAIVNAPAAMNIDLSFLAPKGVRIVSMVNGMPELPRVERLSAPVSEGGASATSESPDLRSSVGQAAYRALLWSPRVLGEFVEANDLLIATFTARLQAGENRISLAYSQPLAWFLTSSGSRRVSILQYELWPILQWKRDPAFALQMQFRLVRPVPGWWQGHFGRVLDLNVYTATLEGIRSPLSEKPIQDKDDLVLAKVFSETIPARLVLVVGEAQDLESNSKAEALVSP